MPHINNSNPRSESPEGRRAKTLSEESRRMRDDESKGHAQSTHRRLVPYEIIASEILKSFHANPVRAMDIFDETGVLRELIPELLFLKNCPQPKKFHSEGDVWTHTRLALSFINSPKFKKEFPIKKSSTNNLFPVASAKGNQSIELILAVLFHDIGKPAVIKINNNKISFHNHAKVGAKIAKNICQRLKLSSAPNFNISHRNIFHLVARHMLHLYDRVSKLKNSTIVKYFLLDSKLGNKLQKLFWLDSMASIPESGKPDLSDLAKLKKRINSLKKQLKITKKKPILTGHDIIKEFKLEPGPKIGKLLSILHETQLAGLIKTKKNAIAFLKREIK